MSQRNMWQVYGLVKDSKIIHIGVKKKNLDFLYDYIIYDNIIILESCGTFAEAFSMCQYQLHVNKVLEVK